MLITPGRIRGTWLIDPNIFEDTRGNFHEVFKLSEIERATHKSFSVRQVNQSKSRAGVVRGIHWTEGNPGQAKFVSCPQGAVWDVVIDLRKDSETFGHWDSVTLSAENKRSLLISEGIGHAFLSLEDESVVNYLCTAEYDPNSERSLNALSPRLAIPFHETASAHGISDLIFSEKDASAGPFFSNIR